MNRPVPELRCALPAKDQAWCNHLPGAPKACHRPPAKYGGQGDRSEHNTVIYICGVLVFSLFYHVQGYVENLWLNDVVILLGHVDVAIALCCEVLVVLF